MNCFKVKLRPALLAVVVFLLSFAAAANGQEREDDPIGQGDEPFQRRQLTLTENDAQPTGRGGARITTKGKVRTTLLVDRGRDVKIVEDPKRGILMEVIQHYGSQQFGKLKGEHPELKDYLDLFPTQIDDQEIELKLSLKQKYRARDSGKLKIDSLEAFEIYRRHIKQNGDHLAKFR